MPQIKLKWFKQPNGVKTTVYLQGQRQRVSQQFQLWFGMKTSHGKEVFESVDLWKLKPGVDEFIPQNPKSSKIGERCRWRENKGKSQCLE